MAHNCCCNTRIKSRHTTASTTRILLFVHLVSRLSRCLVDRYIVLPSLIRHDYAMMTIIPPLDPNNILMMMIWYHMIFVEYTHILFTTPTTRPTAHLITSYINRRALSVSSSVVVPLFFAAHTFLELSGLRANTILVHRVILLRCIREGKHEGSALKMHFASVLIRIFLIIIIVILNEN
jgi:hypothetical protein